MSKKDNEKIESIFLKIKENDKKGLEELYNNCHKMVYGIAFSIMKNKEDAEDIMQVVFAKIQELDKTKLPSAKGMTWLYTLTKNETLNYLKKKKGEVSLENIYEIENKNDEIDKKIDSIEFNRLISKLDKKEQEIISLKILSDFSFQEISELLNEPIGTVKWRYYKSLHSIKRMLGSLAMSIITFVIGTKTILTNVKTHEEQQDTIQEEDNLNATWQEETQDETRQDTNNTDNEELQEEEQNKEMQDIVQEDTTNSTKQENSTQQNNIIENVIPSENEISSNTIIQENEIKQETIANEGMAENQISYVGIGLIGISVIFFIMAIIFFIKYQLKTQKKLSK